MPIETWSTATGAAAREGGQTALVADPILTDRAGSGLLATSVGLMSSQHARYQRAGRQLMGLALGVLVALALSACGDVRRTLEPSDRGSEVIGHLWYGEYKEAGAIIDRYDYRSGNDQIAFLSSAICWPEATEYLLDDVGLSADALSEGGHTVIYELTAYDAEPAKPPCEERQQLESLELLLKRGADPCVAPLDKPAEVPANRASEWGQTPAVVALLEEYSDDCRD